MSPPVQRFGDRKRFWYSLFYTAAQVFPVISAFVYWAVLVPQGYSYALAPKHVPVGRLTLMGDKWLRSFWVVNLWCLTVLVVFVEVMFLNNVKRQVVSVQPSNLYHLGRTPG
jgi:hypothetical protein